MGLTIDFQGCLFIFFTLRFDEPMIHGEEVSVRQVGDRRAMAISQQVKNCIL